MRFDGKAYAKQVEEGVRARVAQLGSKPRVVSILVGDDPASVLYTRLKKATAERVGIEFEIVRLASATKQQLTELIGDIGGRDSVDGMMLQLPIPGMSRDAINEVLSLIPLNKDVDGLKGSVSGVLPATVRAILSILDQIDQPERLKSGKYVVIGAHGSVGAPLVYFLRKRGITNLQEVEWDTQNPEETTRIGDVVISCVGREGIVTPDMIQDDAIVVDVGAPKGDMTEGVYQKASYAVGVPNGVGPVTVACLMANATDLI